MDDVDTLPRFAKQVNIKLSNLLETHKIDGPVCHVGSLINKEGATEKDAARWRTHFSSLPNSEFVGVDIFPGSNVDVIADLCDPGLIDDKPELFDHFGLVFASALLEHVKEPHLVAKNLFDMLKPGGHIYFAGPWVWGFHPYPDDYWRISISGFEVLFPQLEVKQWWYCGTIPNVGLEISDRKLERKLLAQKSISGPASLITDRCMPYLNIGIIAQKAPLRDAVAA